MRQRCSTSLPNSFLITSSRCLAIALLLTLTSAADPLYRHPPLLDAIPVSRNTRPWQPSTPRRRSSRQSYYPRSPPPAPNVLDYSTVRKDPRSRFYSVNFKTRSVGRLSWTSRLVWTTILVFAAQSWKPSLTSWGMKLSDRIRAGQDLYRLFTPIFLHGNIFHLGTNMISLQRTGGDVEKLFGGGRYLAAYGLAGVTGNLMSAWQSPNPSLGASGAVFGVFGAYFVFLSRNEWLLGSYGSAMTNSITQTIAANVFLGLLNPVIDNWAHMGGFLGGAAAAYWFGPRLYLTTLPTTGQKVVIDRPLFRMPRKLEQIPSDMGSAVHRLRQKIPSSLPFSSRQGSSSKPWSQRNSRFKPPRPTQSIKPLPVD